jgi:hypothetical protein
MAEIPGEQQKVVRDRRPETAPLRDPRGRERVAKVVETGSRPGSLANEALRSAPELLMKSAVGERVPVPTDKQAIREDRATITHLQVPLQSGHDRRMKGKDPFRAELGRSNPQCRSNGIKIRNP